MSKTKKRLGLAIELLLRVVDELEMASDPRVAQLYQELGDLPMADPNHEPSDTGQDESE